MKLTPRQLGRKWLRSFGKPCIDAKSASAGGASDKIGRGKRGKRLCKNLRAQAPKVKGDEKKPCPDLQGFEGNEPLGDCISSAEDRYTPRGRKASDWGGTAC